MRREGFRDQAQLLPLDDDAVDQGRRDAEILHQVQVGRPLVVQLAIQIDEGQELPLLSHFASRAVKRIGGTYRPNSHRRLVLSEGLGTVLA